ncbi:slr1658 superfamily regulator [Pseudanabaena sp. PCC 6802]|uniref:slr1658 superfamily regulator n=1 Tax=Pseudanabaena sp. PCC 6802 TaxID=118173 RepID=UPI000381C562|nr:hypothetical protein [Pseudanabaena sp. PCC 6802]
MMQIFGEFIDELPVSEEYLTIHFSPGSTPRKKRWSNYGLSADFLGDYFANFFPGDDLPNGNIDKRANVKGAVSYIANELLENTMKYSDEKANLAVSISLYLYDEKLVFRVINPAEVHVAEGYKTFVQELISSDVDEMYSKQLEQTALGMGGSHMGILTMINDYDAKMGWKFDPLPQQPDVVQVTVMAYLNL